MKKKLMFKRVVGGDAALVAAIVAVLALIVLPLPTFAIDSLIALNLAVSTLLLMVTMYIPSAVSLTSFPSLLLFTTLFRLALNISSTKLILLHADAGHIIESFGNLVVGGNIVVGIVVFLIITIVQFIVIAKGSERVAEVGARFTLDAMPGKQMSIDADLRAGHLTPDDAKRRRSLLAMESQLHGGMDGAMKFVKGDAIAGLIITAINLCAGIVIGVMYHGMTAAQATERFAVLSIGDAMVSQIPSLLICVAAGLVITRVADEDATKRSLGEEMTAQLTRHPRALYLAAAFLCGFAAVPGFPSLVFLALAACLVALAEYLRRKGQSDEEEADPMRAFRREGARAQHGPAQAIEAHAAAFTAPLAVKLSPALAGRLRPEVLGAAFNRERTALQEVLGLPFPGIRLWRTDQLEGDEYEVLLHDVPYLRATSDASGAPDAADERMAGAAGRDGAEGVPSEEEERIARQAVRALREQAHQFLGIQEVHWVLERLGTEYPTLIAELQKVVTFQRVAEVLRRLLEEQVPIRNMRAICESLIVWGPREKDSIMLTEYVRGDLGRFLSHRATRGTGAVSAVLLEPGAEKLIRDSIKATPSGNYLALDPEHMSAICQRVKALVDARPFGEVAVVTSMDIRRYVRRIIESECKGLDVYSYQELGNQVRVSPLGRVGF